MSAVHDFFVRLAPTDSARLAVAHKDRKQLEKFPDWTHRADAAFLMQMGENLFHLAFSTADKVDDFVTDFAATVAADGRLRLWLHTDDPEIAMLPWEYICLPQDAVDQCRSNGVKIEKHQPHTSLPDPQTFLALNSYISLVRQARPDLPEPRLDRIGALRVLIIWANPGSDEWSLINGIETEVTAIVNQLSALMDSHIETRVVEHATKAEVARAMREFRPHVLHYCGHGGFPQVDDPGDMKAPSLVLEKGHTPSKRNHDYLTAAELRDLCAECEVQVVVLNACWGAHTNAKFPGIAYTLAAPGSASPVPVVVAMQMAIPQYAAAGFSARFYQNVALARSIEEGVRTFRSDSAGDHPFGCGVPDWGIPVVFQGVRDSALFRSLRPDVYPISFGEIIKEHVPIVGRRFVKEKFEQFQRDNESGIFLLTAPPGVGKTAFQSQWITDHHDTAHFFYRATAGVTDPDECAKSLCYGLLGSLGSVDHIPSNDPIELRRELAKWIGEVSVKCERMRSKYVIVIDALDEAGKTRQGESALEVLPTSMPPHVYLLITSRPVPLADALARMARVARFDLDPSSVENLDDAVAFCLREFKGRVAETSEEMLCRLSERLAEKAKGNFLILKSFLSRWSLEEQVSVAELERAADDLTGVVEDSYKNFFERVERRIGDSREDRRVLYKVLGAFVTARAPVTPEQICSAFSLQTADLDWALGHTKGFLERGGVRQEEQGALTYRLYHETFREFLSKKLAADLRDHHRRWAEYCLSWRKMKGYERLYSLRHLPSHLIEGSREG